MWIVATMWSSNPGPFYAMHAYAILISSSLSINLLRSNKLAVRIFGDILLILLLVYCFIFVNLFLAEYFNLGIYTD